MKRTKTLSSYFSTEAQSNETPETGASNMHQNNPHVVLNPDDIVADPGLRKPIEDLDVDIRDAARREYLQIGLRNKMNDEWMNHTMVCYIERDIFANISDDKILKRFQGMRSRKKQLSRASGSDSCATINEEMIG